MTPLTGLGSQPTAKECRSQNIIDRLGRYLKSVLPGALTVTMRPTPNLATSPSRRQASRASSSDPSANLKSEEGRFLTVTSGRLCR